MITNKPKSCKCYHILHYYIKYALQLNILYRESVFLQYSNSLAITVTKFMYVLKTTLQSSGRPSKLLRKSLQFIKVTLSLPLK